MVWTVGVLVAIHQEAPAWARKLESSVEKWCVCFPNVHWHRERVVRLFGGETGMIGDNFLGVQVPGKCWSCHCQCCTDAIFSVI